MQGHIDAPTGTDNEYQPRMQGHIDAPTGTDNEYQPRMQGHIDAPTGTDNEYHPVCKGTLMHLLGLIINITPHARTHWCTYWDW